MKSVICIITIVIIILFVSICHAESIVVMDEYDLLTQDEVSDGVLLDPNTMFAYSILPDKTARIERYCWFHKQVVIPDYIQGYRVSSLGNYLFVDVPTEDVFLPNTDISISDSTFDYYEGTVWMQANHPSLAFVTGIMHRGTNIIEYYISTESFNDSPKFRYYVEIDDYPIAR